MISAEPFWVVWHADTDGFVTLEDGREVLVTYGDELLVERTEQGTVIFLEYEARTVH